MSGGLDVRAVRRDFPILERQVGGRPLAYLDSAATSQKPAQAIDAIRRYYEEQNANIHRSAHLLSAEASGSYEKIRQRVARFVGAPDPMGVVFTRNTTEALNHLASAWGRANLGEGDEVVTTLMEHHSSFLPWQKAAAETGARFRVVGLREDLTLDMDELRASLNERTRVVALTHVSNVTGVENPVAEIAALAREVGAMTVLDAAQSVPHAPVDFSALGCDAMAFSAHKMLGPTGVGCLVAGMDFLETLEPFEVGGGMIDEVMIDRFTWAPVPYRFEAGTPNIAGVVAFEAALDYLEGLGMEAVRDHERALTSRALEVLSGIEGVSILGPGDPDAASGIVSFLVGDIHTHDVSTILDSMGVAVRGGHHCCQPLMRHLGIAGTVRASFYVYNTEEEVDRLAEGLVRVQEVFGRVA